MPEFKTLYKELEDAKIPLQEFDLLAEANYALKPHSHEGKIVTYGFIRVEHLAKLAKFEIAARPQRSMKSSFMA
jgi:hypothetical protein